MFTTLVSAAALLSALAIRGANAQDAFTIDTPPMTQCQDTHVTWSGGSAPYNLVIVPSDDPCDQVLVDLGDHNGTSITWNVGLSAGTQVILSLVDANEDEAWSGTVTVGGNSDSSCLAGAPSSSSVAPSSSASSSATASSTDDSVVTPATTLTVPPSPDTAAAYTPTGSAPSSETSESAAIPIGAANAGLNPDFGNGASAMHKIGGSVIALAAIATFFVTM